MSNSQGLSRATLLVLVSFGIACGGLSSTQRTAADDALTSLRKIKAATEVGVNYQQYGLLVIDAKAKVNEASRVLPKGDLNNELNATMEAYADALQGWQMKITSLLWVDREPGKTFVRKYSIPLDPPTTTIAPDNAVPIIWRVASTRLDRATALRQK
jgi:hypothetical protein